MSSINNNNNQNNTNNKVLLSEEEEKIISMLMDEFDMPSVDFFITKMVINNWPEGNNNNIVKYNGMTQKEIDEIKFSNKYGACLSYTKYDFFCHYYAMGSCKHSKTECKNRFNKDHKKMYSLRLLYNNGNTSIFNKRRALYLSHYLKVYCGYNFNLLNNFIEMIKKDIDYDILKISLENTQLIKKQKKMKRKLRRKRRKVKNAETSDDDENNDQDNKENNNDDNSTQDTESTIDSESTMSSAVSQSTYNQNNNDNNNDDTSTQYTESTVDSGSTMASAGTQSTYNYWLDRNKGRNGSGNKY